MQDNTKRADRVLFWIKAIFILFALFWLLFVFMMLSVFFMSEDLLVVLGGILAAGVLFSFISGAVFFLSVFAFGVSYLSWLHRAVSNLRILTTTKFSPMGAVLLTCIPFVGYFLNYFIFSDMVKSQERYMRQKGILKERFPQRILNAWIIASLVLLVLVFVDPNQLGFLTFVSSTFDVDGKHAFQFLEKTLIVVIPILYIMSFSAYVKQERELFEIHTEALFQKRVDEAIRERDIMRAAEKIRKSQGMEKPETDQAGNLQAENRE